VKIMIVEDDPVISGTVCRHIESWGYQCRGVSDFRRVAEEFAEYSPQLVLMDISLPFFNGYYWCAEIRRLSKVPIIFLSSASDGMNIVMAMNMGADDFIAKPFEPEVLMAKIHAMLRRSYDFVNQTSSLLSHGGAVLDAGGSTVTFGNEKLELTKNECRIMQVLMSSPGEIVSREALMQKLWESDSFVDENTLTVNVARLRRKLESVGLRDFIKTRKGAGYLVE